MAVCPACGEENSERARFCQACGVELARAEAPERFRKVVTILFSDVVGSTALGEALDPETLSHVMTEYFHAMRPVLERHGGTVAKFIGDAVMGVFGIPVLHEDDALRAVRAAVAMRERLDELNRDLDDRWGVTIATRTGIATGPVAGEGLARDQNFVAGDTANTAARLQQGAPPGDILLTEATFELTGDAVEVEAVQPMAMRNKAAPVSAFRVVRTVDVEAVARRLDTPLVGRAGEMARLEGALDEAIGARAARIVTLLGPAGVGKSRLAREFLVRAGGSVRAIQGRCLPYGEGITYWPLAQAIRQAAGIAEQDTPAAARAKLDALADGDGNPDGRLVADRVAQVIGLHDGTGSGSASPEEIPWAVRRLLEHVAADVPLVLLLDDLQWAEPALLDLVQHVSAQATGAPILLLCLARPEFAESGPGWSDPVVVPALSATESDRMIASLLEGGGLAPEVVDRIVRSSGGNPLFLEQLLWMLVDRGLLERRAEGWAATSDLSDLAIPPTIHALLSARLDGIPPDERAVLRLASVIGEVFYVPALRAMAPERLAAGIGAALESLARKDMVRSERSDLGSMETFAFGHLLIRDAAYEGVTKEDRASLHERFADWLEAMAADRSDEVDEIVGYHLERSWRYRTEVGRAGPEARRVAERAAAHLGRAGRRAFGRGEGRTATALLDRAIGLSNEETPERAEQLLTLAEALRYQGEPERAREVHGAAAALVDRLSDARLQGRALVGTAGLLFSFDTGRWLAEGHELLDRAAALLAATGDELGMAVVSRFRGYLEMQAGRTAEAGEHYRAGVEHARAAGDDRELGQCLSNELLALTYGMTPVDEALARCEEEEARSPGPYMTGQIGLSTMLLLAARADLDDARFVAERTRGVIDEMGLRRTIAGLFSLTLANIELLAWDLQEAERVLRSSCAALEEMQEGTLCGSLAMLGLVLAYQGRPEEALALLDRADPLAGPDFTDTDRITIAAARALALSAIHPEDAVAVALPAAAAAAKIEMPFDAGEWLLALAEALRRTGRRDEAEEAAARALDLCRRKGIPAMVARAGAILAAVSG